MKSRTAFWLSILLGLFIASCTVDAPRVEPEPVDTAAETEAPAAHTAPVEPPSVSPPTAEILPGTAAGSPPSITVSPGQSSPDLSPALPSDGGPPPQSVTDPSWARFLPAEEWAEKNLRSRGIGPKSGRRTVVLDPGHGGPEVGAVYGSHDGRGYIAEKDANLRIALRLKAMLEASGYRVVLTRESDERAYTVPDEEANRAFSGTRADLQGRVDVANAAEADIFVSIHNNGASDSAQSGTEVWYSSDRPFSHLSYRLAQDVLDSLIAQLAAAGYNPPNRGIKDGANFRVFQGRSFPLFVLGRPRTEPRPTRATNMPGILGETLFLSNPREGALLRDPAIIDAIAMGYRNGIARYFGSIGGSM